MTVCYYLLGLAEALDNEVNINSQSEKGTFRTFDIEDVVISLEIEEIQREVMGQGVACLEGDVVAGEEFYGYLGLQNLHVGPSLRLIKELVETEEGNLKEAKKHFVNWI